jgi:hypothetical protein
LKSAHIGCGSGFQPRFEWDPFPMISWLEAAPTTSNIICRQTCFLEIRSPFTAATKFMKIFFLIFFILIGALDFAYGLIYKDQLSIVAGGAIVAITVYIWKKKK